MDKGDQDQNFYQFVNVLLTNLTTGTDQLTYLHAHSLSFFKLERSHHRSFSPSMGTHGLRFLRDFFANLLFFRKIFLFFVFFCFFLLCFYFYFFIIFMIRMKSSPLVSGFSLTSLMSLLITLSVDYFCRFQPCNGIMWFRGSDCKPLLTPLSKSQWNVVKCQNSELTDIFCSVCEFWQFYFWVFNLIT